jgi:hypothetical protein
VTVEVLKDGNYAGEDVFIEYSSPSIGEVQSFRPGVEPPERAAKVGERIFQFRDVPPDAQFYFANEAGDKYYAVLVPDGFNALKADWETRLKQAVSKTPTSPHAGVSASVSITGEPLELEHEGFPNHHPSGRFRGHQDAGLPPFPTPPEGLGAAPDFGAIPQGDLTLKDTKKFSQNGNGLLEYVDPNLGIGLQYNRAKHQIGLYLRVSVSNKAVPGKPVAPHWVGRQVAAEPALAPAKVTYRTEPVQVQVLKTFEIEEEVAVPPDPAPPPAAETAEQPAAQVPAAAHAQEAGDEEVEGVPTPPKPGGQETAQAKTAQAKTAQTKPAQQAATPQPPATAPQTAPSPPAKPATIKVKKKIQKYVIETQQKRVEEIITRQVARKIADRVYPGAVVLGVAAQSILPVALAPKKEDIRAAWR